MFRIEMIGGNVIEQKTVSIQERIPVEIYNELLDLGNGKLNDGIQRAVNLARTMDVIRKSETNEEIKIWKKMFSFI